LVDDAAQQLRDTSDSPRIDAEILLQWVVERPMSWVIAYGDTVASAEHIKAFSQVIAQRHTGTPVAYLLGHREFWTLKLNVDSNVLIPRADTETLVEAALAALDGHPSPTVLDLGTGTGAIALAIAKERPDARITAADISPAALKLAVDNAAINGIDNTQFVHSRWYDDLDNTLYDLITANPPYLAPDDPHLQKGDLRFEPDIALIAEQDGLADLTEIIAGARNFLASEGYLIVEHGCTQAEAVRALMQEAHLCDITLHKDLNQLPRCTMAKLRHE
jgi:release factor glutamine methyltransferase